MNANYAGAVDGCLRLHHGHGGACVCVVYLLLRRRFAAPLNLLLSLVSPSSVSTSSCLDTSYTERPLPMQISSLRAPST